MYLQYISLSLSFKIKLRLFLSIESTIIDRFNLNILIYKLNNWWLVNLFFIILAKYNYFISSYTINNLIHIDFQNLVSTNFFFFLDLTLGFCLFVCLSKSSFNTWQSNGSQWYFQVACQQSGITNRSRVALSKSLVVRALVQLEQWHLLLHFPNCTCWDNQIWNGIRKCFLSIPTRSSWDECLSSQNAQSQNPGITIWVLILKH